MNFKEGWQHKDEAFFIDLVRQHPPLWNTADKNYAKKTVKTQLYSQVAEEFRKRCPYKVLTSVSARRKFCRLRSYFQQEFRRMITKKNDNPKWIHFHKMLFLATEDERKKLEYGLNISIVNMKGGTTHDDNKMELGAIVPNTSYSDSNEELGSMMSLLQSNKDSVPPLQQTSPNTSSPKCDSSRTEPPVILKAWSTPESGEGTDSLQSSLHSSEGDSEPPLKQNTSSPMCDSNKTLPKACSTAERPPAFHVALGNLVVASLNQMPVEKANAATKEIFDVLLKYGSESNHRR